MDWFTKLFINEAKTALDKHVCSGSSSGSSGGSSGGSSVGISEEEILELLMDMDVVQPLSNTNNAMYVDENDKIYVL